jgi:hypothetical protein
MISSRAACRGFLFQLLTGQDKADIVAFLKLL